MMEIKIPMADNVVTYVRGLGNQLTYICLFHIMGSQILYSYITPCFVLISH